MSNTKETYKGIAAAPGFARGPLFLFQESNMTLPEPYQCKDPEIAWERVLSAIEDSKKEIRSMRARVLQEAGKEQAAIFDAHEMMVDDAALHEMTQASIQEGINPEKAWFESVEVFADMLADLPDPLLSARAADVRDVGRRVLAHLLGIQAPANVLMTPSIVIARDLAPSQTALMDHSMVLAFCTAEGGPTSHTAILAKALRIPAVVGLGDAILEIQVGDLTLVDADSGRVTVNPDAEDQAAFLKLSQVAAGQRFADLSTAFEPAVTFDGKQVEVVANIGGLADARQSIEMGAEGVGLFRTEFVYLNRKSLPTVDEQVKIYRQIFDTMIGKPVVVRTVDIGGDKQIDYLGINQEPNPFLGWRGIRMISEKPEILSDQLLALMLAARDDVDLRIMLPMVSQVEEVLQARVLLDEAYAKLRQQYPDCTRTYQFGMMVEVPSAALTVEHFAPYVDFYSIGTNDLTQYTLAADRMNARVANLASPFHPAVLSLIERTVRIAHEHGKWVGMCGELAGEPLAVPFLLGIGLDEFSMSAAAVPAIKRIIRKLNSVDCQPVARNTLTCHSADAVREYLQSELNRLIAV